ncbi:zinc-finger-containing protein [Methylobacterium dankookense]|uniref:Uncharacterized protein n=1 Tax=Methylobacterium dankookense TaxID=560405 RepID=A0A564G5D0_9HYPH|nr:zinc-finger-containing protein [Methylobacterium dankookense]GJD55215.1 hypothetical protein IFDJLNFL_1099 [Methylobacterium dankookense]VUF15206.1 hypothetical protein MTDSW087_04941 [Methylobacterium dankookense]
MTAAVTPPTCSTCQKLSRLTDGREIYPGRSDLHANRIYVCDGCGAYVGCHEGSDRPLGTLAGPQLRAARIKLHERMVDPLWRFADRCGAYEPESEAAREKIRRAARVRVYSFLADRMGLSRDETHVSMFDLEQCRDAWRALQGVTYPEIRAWAHARRHAAKSKQKRPAAVPIEGTAA